MPEITTVSRRLTHRYVGTWQHLDQWQDVGTIKLLGGGRVYDPYEQERYYLSKMRVDQSTIYGRHRHLIWGGRKLSKTEIQKRLDDWSNDGEGDLHVFRVVVVRDDLKLKPKEWAKAIADEFTQVGCSHEYDCCGCASHRASVRHAGGRDYVVSVRTSYNV